MKRLLTLAAMFLCCMATSFAQFSGSGSGTESDPYLILNPIQLNQIRNFANQGKVYFKLMADIDLTEFIEDEYPNGRGWLPIPSFNGVLDGNGKKISSLWIDRASSDNIGLFSEATGTIKNLSLKNVNIKGKENVGVLVGTAEDLTIDNCYVEGNIVGENSVGGFSGNCDYQDYVNFENLTGKVNVTATGNYVGGIFGGYSDRAGSFNNCKIFDSSISGVDYVGGLTGRSSSISNSSYVGVVYGHSYVGGLAGDHGAINISESYVYGDIQASGDYVGGIAGLCYGYIYNCQFYGNLHGENYIGGIVGYYFSWKDYSKTNISNCFVNAKVSGDDNVGGICGFLDNECWWSYLDLQKNVSASTRIIARGEKNPQTRPLVGLIYGAMSGGNITSGNNKSYNRAIILSQGIAIDVEENENNGTGVSAATLKLKATYVDMGWDFNDTWEIQETECYPYFKTQTAPPVITSDVVSGATTISGKCVSGSTVTLDIDGVKQQTVSGGSSFSFSVEPLQAGHEVCVSAKAEGMEPSYYVTQTVSYLGKGTEADPYQVYTAADLTGAYRKGYYKQMNDIDLTDYINQFSPTEGWESIGRDGSETIHFDGDGHKITGLWCNSTRDNTGLFSCFANGTIKNLTVETASGKKVKGGSNTGILIGKMINGTIENCRVSGDVADGTRVGGIVGLLDGGKISLSQANVTINTTGATSYVGGIVGEITSGEIDQCVTLGTLTATGTESYVGGLVGKNSATVTNCYSNANVNSSYNAAGLIAYNYGLVDKCYATGDLFSNNYGAGVIGYNDGSSAVVKNCVAMNNKIDVTYESQSAQSGGYGQRIIGGIKNGAPAPEMNNYALKTMQVSVNDLPQKVYDDIMNGVAKAGTELVKQATYQELGWSFTDVWSIAEDESYPSLKKNAATVIGPPVTITAKNYTIEYGDDLPTFEYTCDGTISGTPSITCEATKTSPVGTYPIVISKGSVTNNNVTYVNGTLTITKAPLKITAKDYTIKQGDALPTFEATYEGFKNSETSTVLTKKPTITTTATSASEPGEYDITVSGAEAQNYKISYVKGKLIVTERPVFVLKYMVDGILYKSYSIKEGDKITPEPLPTKEGYTFSGWSEIPATMPAHDVTVTGNFTINKYKLTYIVDGVEYKSSEVEYGSAITPEAEPTKEGYTFSGWREVPETMPAHDVIVTGTFIVNQYTITYMIDDEVYQTESVDYGSTITPPEAPEREGYTFEWTDVPETMPAHDITIVGSYTSGISTIKADDEDVKWYTLDGKQIELPRKGLNIVRMSNGKTKKVLVK